MKQEGESFGKNGRTHMTKTPYFIGHRPKGRDHNMENTTVIWDIQFSGLTEKTAMFEMKQSTKLPRHHVPEDHNLHIHCYLNLESQNTAATGTHSNDQQLWSKNAGNWRTWEEEEKIRGSRKIKEIIKVL
jgi:hypothetical protein